MTKPFDDTNRGSIWKNDRKESEKHPDFTGHQNTVCPHCNKTTYWWVSAWKRKEGASPRAPALGWSLKQKDGQRVAGKPDTAARPSLKDEMDDFIPF